MAELLKNLVGGSWVAGKGPGPALLDPVTGAEVARVSSEGIDLAAAFEVARVRGGGALRALTYVVSPAVAQQQTGHGNVMPHSLHGGPERAGGGEELGGLRALAFYHRRSAIQAETAALDAVAAAPLVL